ncbi:MAG: hypothetical protein Kow0077_00340 [Anaerolineae bacterium]
MTIHQHYYTSCRNPDTARTGFQVKAATPGISRRAEAVLQKLIGYRPPANADPNAIGSHPVSLRFYVPNPQEAMLICAQSNGPDEFGRPGNFFAHSLIGPVEAFTDPLPPIFYWGSPFWVRRDETPQTTLPALESLAGTVQATFNYDAVWDFLTGPRREWFYALVCAALDHARSKRRIILVDTSENTALWIATLTMALPEMFRPHLTFATYHHDPYNVPFMVTGTTPDSSFRFMPDEYRAYFILNALENRISDAPDSVFARYVTTHFTAGEYESAVLDLFALIKRRAASSTLDPAHLDRLTEFFALQRGERDAIPPAQRVTAARTIITDVADMAKPGAEDANDLRSAWGMIADALLHTGNADLLPDFSTALSRLHAIDPAFASTCNRACVVYAQCVINAQTDLASAIGALLRDLYGEEALRAEFSQPALLQALTQQLRKDNPAQLQAFWQHCGPLIDGQHPALAEALQIAFERTLMAAERAAAQPGLDPLEIPQGIEHLLAAWLNTQATTGPVIHALERHLQQHPGSPLPRWVYAVWVQAVPYDRRTPVRGAFGQLTPDLAAYELRRDLLTARNQSDRIVAALQIRLDLVNPAGNAAMLAEALDFLWARADLPRERLAAAILGSQTLAANLDDAWLVRLVEATVRSQPLTEPDAATLALYQRLLTRDDLHLSREARTTIQGAISLATGELHPSIVDHLNRRFRAMDESRYREAAGQMIDRFFAVDDPADTHALMVTAAYAPEYRAAFWELYWAAFTRYALNEEQADAAARALDFWFMAAQGDAARLLRQAHPFLLADFFLTLPGALSRLQAEKGYNRAGRQFDTLVRQYSWIELLADHFPEAQRSRGLFKGLFDR